MSTFQSRKRMRLSLGVVAVSAGLLLAACGSSSESGSSRTQLSLEPDSGGRVLIANFAYGGNYLITGAPQRMSFVVGVGGAPTTDAPPELRMQLSKDGQDVGDPIVVPQMEIGGGIEYQELRRGNRVFPLRLGARTAKLPFHLGDEEAPTEWAVSGGIGLRLVEDDFGPLAVFFAVNTFMGGPQLMRMLAATAAFMVAIFVAMGVSLWKTKHISPMLWISGALVLVFGGLTLWFRDETFIKVKPTIVYAMFAIVLAYGLITKKPLLQMLLESAYPGLTAKGWRLLTINWTVFFAAMAVLNEIVWRTQSWDFWVGFKLWGVVPLTLIFAMGNIPMLLRNGLTTDREIVDKALPPEG